MSVYVWAVLVAIAAVSSEALYRALPGPWSRHAAIWIPLNILTGWLIYNMITMGKTLIDAFVVGTFATQGLRLLVTLLILREPVAAGSWVAFGLMLSAQVARVVIR